MNKTISSGRDRSELLIGDDNPLLLTITAVNRGEGAYEAELHTLIPPEADYVGVRRSAEVQKCMLLVHVRDLCVCCDIAEDTKNRDMRQLFLHGPFEAAATEHHHILLCLTRLRG